LQPVGPQTEGLSSVEPVRTFDCYIYNVYAQFLYHERDFAKRIYRVRKWAKPFDGGLKAPGAVDERR
jgi:hypothetical protein